MAIKRCPNCGLLVDERHRYCGCGYDWDMSKDEFRHTPAGHQFLAERRRRFVRPVLGVVAALLVLVIAWLILSVGLALSGMRGH